MRPIATNFSPELDDPVFILLTGDLKPIWFQRMLQPVKLQFQNHSPSFV